jgi:hypothetical protein
VAAARALLGHLGLILAFLDNLVAAVWALLVFWLLAAAARALLGHLVPPPSLLVPSCGGRKSGLVAVGPLAVERKGVLGPSWADLGLLGPSCGRPQGRSWSPEASLQGPQ